MSGASGEEPTVLVADSWLPVIQRVGSHSTWSGIEYRTGDGQILDHRFGGNVTLSDSVFSPREHTPHAPGAGLVPYRRGNYSVRLHRNRFAGWGKGEGNVCDKLIDAGGYGARLYVQRNVFTDNDCTALVDAVARKDHSFGAFPPNDGAVDLVLSGNTVIGGGPVLMLGGPSDRLLSVNVVNNLVVDVESGAVSTTDTNGNSLDANERALFWSAAGSGDRRWLESASNLVRNSGGATFLPAESAGSPHVAVLAPDVQADPLLVDGTELSAMSPAVDAGHEPPPYAWHTPTVVCSRYQCFEPPPSGFAPEALPAAPTDAAPIDGDGDGIAEHDIGAHEYAP